MKYYKFISGLFILFCLFVILSCKNANEFAIKGEIEGGHNKVLYLEHVGTYKTEIIDSVKLNESGSFNFKKNRPEIPEFYRLRLDAQIINLSIDSTETITIKADTSNFARSYTIEGSLESETIKEISLLQNKTAQEYNKLQKAFNSGEISEEDYQLKASNVIGEYKDKATKVIFDNPKSTASYFALLQQINNLLIFDPYDKDDYRVYGAVATSWNQYYPDAERSKHLYNLALQGLKVIRGKRPVEYQIADAKKYFEITLPNIDGKLLKLSEFNPGNITLLDFTIYESAASPEHNMILGEIYEKYKDKGFDIYQVSLDGDIHFWKNAAINIPWAAVRDEQSVYSEIAGMYNIKEVPTSFIIDKNGDIVKRLDPGTDIEQEIKTYL